MSKSKTAEISIIIPVYNAEKYINACLNSIKNQTFHDYEIILVDDGSSDMSAEYVEKFIKQNPGLKIHFLKNGRNIGANYSRNRGFDIAVGKYVCFIDADDICHSQYMELLHTEAVRKKADIVFYGYDRLIDGKIISYTKTWKYPNYNSITLLKYAFLTSITHICHCTILYHRRFLIKHNLKYYEACRYGADTELVIKVLFKNPAFSCVKKTLYYYNIHSDSITTRLPSEINLDGYWAYKRAKDSLKNPLWKMLFTCTRESRKVYHLLNDFYSHDVSVPYWPCSKMKTLFLLTINFFVKRDSASRDVLKKYITNIKKE